MSRNDVKVALSARKGVIIHHPYTFYSSWMIGEMMRNVWQLNFIIHISWLLFLTW